MTTVERLAHAVLDGRGALAVELVDAVRETNSGFASRTAEKARAAERERIVDRLPTEASYVLHHSGDPGEAQAAALEHVAQELMDPAPGPPSVGRPSGWRSAPTPARLELFARNTRDG